MSDAALPVLRTPRLTLRPLTDDDADAIARGIGNFDVSKWLAVVPYPYGRKAALTFIAKVQASGKPFWAICDKDGVQGVVCLDDELAYWLARGVWGRGYGFEAARAAIEFWFSDPAAGDLVSGYFEGNDGSGALLRALGFGFEEQVARHARSFRQEVLSNRLRLTRVRWAERQGFTLYTPRLTLRPMTVDDASALVALARPEVARGTSSVVADWSETEARDWIAGRLWQGVPGFFLAVEHGGRLVGAVGLGGAPVGIGYMFHPDTWGQGFATEALSAMLPEVFERFPLTRLHATVFEDNPASSAVLDKFGFIETGRDTGTSKARLEPAPIITYALTRDSLKVPL